ncbi:TIGR03086 family metal-binding protein [Streptomyces sp. NPDC005963]|uniref:TIGR03086 family metal-binding protein n=1 Tax=Streptomyces sp. NPDC005963 TaxID=3156721 RepID=UPI003403635A
MNDPRPLYERAADQFATLLETVTPLRLGDPTPCSEFDVRALLLHSVNGLHLMAHIGENGDWKSAPPPVSAIADDAWRGAYEDAHRRFGKAWSDDAKLGSTVSSPWAEETVGAAMIGFALLETVVHGWDLSEALGRPAQLDPTLAEAVIPIAHDALPADRRGGAVPFGAVREAPAGADAYDRLAAWLGREVPDRPRV